MASASGLRVQFGLLLLLGACAPAQEKDQPGEAASTASGPTRASELTCLKPIGRGDTAASLRQRYGDQARVETLHGPEGIEFSGLALWPEDPARRIEVAFADEAQQTVSSITLGPASRWRVASLAIGDAIARANAANGKPFKLWGFSWDYGGYASDLAGGNLAALPGGCRAVLRFAPREGAEVADALVGDVELSSDDPRLDAAGVTIEELSLAF